MSPESVIMETGQGTCQLGSANAVIACQWAQVLVTTLQHFVTPYSTHRTHRSPVSTFRLLLDLVRPYCPTGGPTDLPYLGTALLKGGQATFARQKAAQGQVVAFCSASAENSTSCLLHICVFDWLVPPVLCSWLSFSVGVSMNTNFASLSAFRSRA